MLNRNLKYRFHGKIAFTMDKERPDVKCVEDWTEDKVLTFEDYYEFSMDYTKDEIESYIKHDLMLVAGGGYNTYHIHNVTFEIRQA